jgi:hypothetical protein
MILVPLLNPKFATVPAAKSCELRVRGTRALSVQLDPARRHPEAAALLRSPRRMHGRESATSAQEA